MNPGRFAKTIWLKALRRRSLSQRFLLMSFIVISMAMVVLGWWIGVFVQGAITRGVSETAAASVSSLITHAVGDVALNTELDDDDRAQLARAFATASEADSTSLFNVRIRNRGGQIVYQADHEFLDEDAGSDGFTDALAGSVRARLLQVALPAVGTLPSYPVDVLEIYAPVRSASTGEIVGVAELFFSADAVNRLRDEAQRMVWLLVGLGGLLVVAALYLLVDRSTRTIARQRRRLASELAATRRLSSENLALSHEAQDLRRQATTANETLLAHIGSDIHDGPIQLLTLTILKLTKARTKGSDELTPSIDAVTAALDELRRISTGLVLPELADATLDEAIEAAISRHENLTGTTVERTFEGVDFPAGPSVNVTAYRVVQEALNNAFRHGGGKGQGVTAILSNGVLSLSIESDTGVQAPQPEQESKLGLRGMRFRVESVGGTLDIKFGSPRTKVTATYPVTPGIDAAATSDP